MFEVQDRVQAGLSGFVQHLESRSCGLADSTQIEGYFNDLTGKYSHLLKM